MTEAPVSLETRRNQAQIERAVTANDPALWTPEQVLTNALQRIKDGTERADGVMLLLTSRSKDGNAVPGTIFTAKLTVLEMFGLLDISKLALLQQER